MARMSFRQMNPPRTIPLNFFGVPFGAAHLREIRARRIGIGEELGGLPRRHPGYFLPSVAGGLTLTARLRLPPACPRLSFMASLSALISALIAAIAIRTVVGRHRGRLLPTAAALAAPAASRSGPAAPLTAS